MKYPVLAIEPKSFTWLFHSEEDAQKMPIGFIGIYRRKIRSLEFFDSAGSVWKLDSIEPRRKIPFWSYLIHGLRETDVEMKFSLLGASDLERMKEALRVAVDADDDILTQFEERDVILEKLDRTKSIGEVFRLYRWMRKDFKKRANQPVEPTSHGAPRRGSRLT